MGRNNVRMTHDALLPIVYRTLVCRADFQGPLNKDTAKVTITVVYLYPYRGDCVEYVEWLAYTLAPPETDPGGLEARAKDGSCDLINLSVQNGAMDVRQSDATGRMRLTSVCSPL